MCLPPTAWREAYKRCGSVWTLQVDTEQLTCPATSEWWHYIKPCPSALTLMCPSAGDKQRTSQKETPAVFPHSSSQWCPQVAPGENIFSLIGSSQETSDAAKFSAGLGSPTIYPQCFGKYRKTSKWLNRFLWGTESTAGVVERWHSGNVTIHLEAPMKSVNECSTGQRCQQH